MYFLTYVERGISVTSTLDPNTGHSYTAVEKHNKGRQRWMLSWTFSDSTTRKRRRAVTSAGLEWKTAAHQAGQAY